MVTRPRLAPQGGGAGTECRLLCSSRAPSVFCSRLVKNQTVPGTSSIKYWCHVLKNSQVIWSNRFELSSLSWLLFNADQRCSSLLLSSASEKSALLELEQGASRKWTKPLWKRRSGNADCPGPGFLKNNPVERKGTSLAPWAFSFLKQGKDLHVL